MLTCFIQDLLTDMNSYPFLNNKVRPVFTTTLRDITPGHVRESHIIDLSSSPLVPATELRFKLDALHVSGEIDSGLPVLRDGVLVGLIPAPDLEFALDKLDGREEDCLCLMSPQARWAEGPETDGMPEDDASTDRTDFTPYIDPVSMTPRKSTQSLSTSDTLRHLCLWISIVRWILCTNVSSNWDCGMSVF